MDVDTALNGGTANAALNGAGARYQQALGQAKGAVSAESKAEQPAVQRMQQVVSQPPPATPNLGKSPTAPDPQQIQKDSQAWMTAISAMAALFGARGRARGTGALKSYAAGLKGIQEGNQQAFDNSLKKWKADTEAMQADNKTELEKYDAILKNRDLTESEAMMEFKMIAAEHQNQTGLAMENLHQAAAFRDSLEHAMLSFDYAQKKTEAHAAAKEKELQDAADKQAAVFSNIDKMNPNDRVPGTNLTVAALKQKQQQYSVDASVLARGGMPMADKGAVMDYDAFVNHAAEKTGGEVEALQAGFKADSASLVQLQKQADAAISFEHTAQDNFKLAMQLAPEAVPNLGPLMNRWVMEGETMLGDKTIPAYQQALISAVNEYAKIQSGATGAAGSTVDARKDARDHFSTYFNVGQLKPLVDVATKEMGNRELEYNKRIEDIKGRISGKTETDGANSPQGGAVDLYDKWGIKKP